MDTNNATLKQLLDTLSENNGSADWNMYKNKRGKVIVKISFDKTLDDANKIPDMNLDNEDPFGTKFRTVSDNQGKRNYLRAKSYSKKRKLSNSPEILRNVSVSEKDPGNVSMYSPRCLSTESMTHIAEASVCSDSLIQSSPEASVCLLNQSASICEGSNDAGSDRANQAADEDHLVTTSNTDETESHYLDSQPSSNHDISQYTPTPFDSDSESNYDNNAEYLDVWPEYREPCDKSGCDYRPSDMEGYDENNQLGLRPNGTHELYYLCELCGRKFCDSCVWVRRRHLHHMSYVRLYARSGPKSQVDMHNLMNGIF